MTLEEPGHPPHLRDRLTGRQKLLIAGLAGRATALTLSSKVGTGPSAELFGLPLMVGELGLDAPEIALGCPSTLLAMEVARATATARSQKLLIASWVRASELLRAQVDVII